MHNKLVYEVNYPDGTTEKLTANTIDENMLLRVDYEGQNYQLFTEVTDKNRYDSTITKVDGFINYSNGNLHKNTTTRGWKLLVQWKDVSVYWVPLNDLKQSNTVELAEYSVSN